MFEDLIADLYARLYEINISHLVEQVPDENKEKMKVDHLLMGADVQNDPSTPVPSVPASDTPAPRGRTKGIARRDIQKRADTIVNTKLAPRLPASKVAAAEAEQNTPAQVDSTPAGPTSAPRESQAALPDGNAEQRDERDGEETESEIEDTKLEEGTSRLFPLAADAEEGDTENDNENEGEGEGEGEEGDGDEADGEDEEMQDEETKLEDEDETQDEETKLEDEKDGDQSANDTETEPVNGNSEAADQDAMEITADS